MEIYVLRHGQTDYNVQGKFQGQIDTKLNEKGLKQVKQAYEKLKNTQFDLVVSSPLDRAVQTAKIVRKKDKIILENRLIERSFGKLEGQFSIPNYEEMIDYYNIETMNSLFYRVYSFLDEIKNYNYNKILLVTHEGVAQIIQCYFEGIPDKDMQLKYRLNNGEYKIYKYNN